MLLPVFAANEFSICQLFRASEAHADDVVPFVATIASNPVEVLLKWEVVRSRFVTLLTNFVFVLSCTKLVAHHFIC